MRSGVEEIWDGRKGGWKGRMGGRIRNIVVVRWESWWMGDDVKCAAGVSAKT